MGRSRVIWAIGAVAPWCLGTGLAVSFPAGAGHDALIGGTITPITSVAPSAPQDLIKSANILNIGDSIYAAVARSGIGSDDPDHGARVRQARLIIGNESEKFREVPDEVEPRIVMKDVSRRLPRPDRSGKGDPVIGLRPTFDAKLRGNGSFRSYATELQIFSGEVLGFNGFRKSARSAKGGSSVKNGDQSGTNVSATPSNGSATGGTATGLTNGMAADLVSVRMPGYLDGASPKVPRAIALSSATPVQASKLVRLVSGPMLLAGAAKKKQAETTKVAKRVAKLSYVAILAKARKPRQRKCLTQAIYFEARSESAAGQAAVAQVILNRVMSRLYPSSVCGVVFQNSHRYKACQFTFTCEGKSLRVRDRRSWSQAKNIADAVLGGKTYLAKVGRSTHYHATYVRPRWAKRLKRMKKIGTHIFYKLRPGQT